MKFTLTVAAALLIIGPAFAPDEPMAAPRGTPRIVNPMSKAKTQLTAARLKKAKAIQQPDAEASATYQQGATKVTLSIAPARDADLAIWTVKTEADGLTTEATTVVDATFPFMQEYREAQTLPNGDTYAETASVSRTGYEAVPLHLVPPRTTITRRVSRTVAPAVYASVAERYEFSKKWTNKTPTRRELTISAGNDDVRIDLASATPVISGQVTATLVAAKDDLASFLATSKLALPAQTVAKVIAAIAAAEVMPAGPAQTMQQRVQAMWDAAVR